MNERLRESAPAALAAAFAALSFLLPIGVSAGGVELRWPSVAGPFVFACFGLFAALLLVLRPPRLAGPVLWFAVLCLAAALAPLILLANDVRAALDASAWHAGFWLYTIALALLAFASVHRVAALDAERDANALARYGALYATPLLFGAWVLVFWQLLTRAFEVPQVLLPAPSTVWHSLEAGLPTLAGDFVQTVLHSVLIGLALGCALGFAVGVLIDRSPFLQRGLLPIAALASTVPLVGIAPIMVMWFGFDWHSKAAVVVIMTFFPMLVNTLAGLRESGAMERDLMHSYGAGYWRTLVALRIPVALPFVFNALKINSTLAMIGAIVAEFFGSPVAGLGFRISTEAARLNMGLVWAAILVAALAGSVLYGLLGWLERRTTFWHPSIRARV
ncbi:MAG TPA: ABC transporter permease [Burkholderiaceae bacterium]|nr:ABC transporter permease [Burkholderiaceae bacterium]